MIDTIFVSSIDGGAAEVLLDASRRMTRRGGTLVVSCTRQELRARLEGSGVALSPPDSAGTGVRETGAS